MKTLLKIFSTLVLISATMLSQAQEAQPWTSAQAFGIPQGVAAETFASQLCQTVSHRADGTWEISQDTRSQAPQGIITIVDCRQGFSPSLAACNVFAFTSGVRAVNCGDRTSGYYSYVVAGLGASAAACENTGRHTATCFDLFTRQ